MPAQSNLRRDLRATPFQVIGTNRNATSFNQNVRSMTLKEVSVTMSEKVVIKIFLIIYLKHKFK